MDQITISTALYNKERLRLYRIIEQSGFNALFTVTAARARYNDNDNLYYYDIGFDTHHRIRASNKYRIEINYNKTIEDIVMIENILKKEKIKYEYSKDEYGVPTLYVPHSQPQLKGN